MENKVVLITGASSGMGESTAVHLASVGYRRLALVARREAVLNRIADECRAAGAKDVLVIPADLATKEGAVECVTKTVEHFNRENTQFAYSIDRSIYRLPKLFSSLLRARRVHLQCGNERSGRDQAQPHRGLHGHI